jgi:hypothetical protein
MKRTLLALALVAGVLMQVIHAVPAHAMASLRAMACCAHGCNHGCSPSEAMRCCGVQHQDDAATISAVGKEHAPRFVAHLADRTPRTFGEPTVVSPAAAPRHERASPLFLLVRSLRL